MLMLAGGILYLDSYRTRLIDQRRESLRQEAELIAESLSGWRGSRDEAVARFGSLTGARVRVYAGAGAAAPAVDSWQPGSPTFELRDPSEEPWRRQLARTLDRVLDTLAGAPAPPDFPARWPAPAGAWPEVGEAQPGLPADRLWRAPDRTSIVSTAAVIPGSDARVQLISNARDITFAVRDERWRSFRLFLMVLAATLALSVFLARTIAAPLRQLANAAAQVRLGRAREVVVPRLPERGDEIGQLARTLSDMTATLRKRIDATEAFAADVAHELRNPLASLQSAIETLPRVANPEQRRALEQVIANDISRIDRLLSAIADASRLDAELSRVQFVPVNLGALARSVIELTPPPDGVAVAFSGEDLCVLGHPDRLGQVVRNLLDNAYGFAPPGSTVLVRSSADRPGWVALSVEDAGPGIPAEAQEAVFERFWTLRPGGSGQYHSGLGLAIARAVAEAHGGSISADNAPAGGARVRLRLPAA